MFTILGEILTSKYVVIGIATLCLLALVSTTAYLGGYKSGTRDTTEIYTAQIEELHRQEVERLTHVSGEIGRMNQVSHDVDVQHLEVVAKYEADKAKIKSLIDSLTREGTPNVTKNIDWLDSNVPDDVVKLLQHTTPKANH